MTATVFDDTFTDTAGVALVGAHTPDVGAAWQNFGTATQSAAPKILSDGSVGNSTSLSSFSYQVTGTANNNDGESFSVQTVYSTSAASQVGVGIRGNAAAGNGYVVLVNSTGSHNLYRVIGTTGFTPIGASFSRVVTDSPLVTVEAVTNAGNVQISVKFNGVHVTGSPFTDSNAARITAVGGGVLALFNLTTATTGFRATRATLTNNDLAPTDSITATSPTANQIVQRNATTGGTGAVTVAGTYVGTPTTIERRVVLEGTSTVVSGFDWATAVASPAAGTFSFNVSGVPSALQKYQVQLRFSNNTAITTTSNAFMVGHLGAITGQSNGVNFFTTGGGPAAAAFTYYTGIGVAGWQVPIGAGAKQLANALSAAMGCPVGLVYAAYSGTPITGWHPPSGTQYANSLPHLQQQDMLIGDMVWVQGENEINAMNYATYTSHLVQVAPAYRTDLGRPAMPFHVVALASTTTTPRAFYDEVKKAQFDYALGTALAYLVDRTDCALVDGIHHSAAGFVELANRVAQSVLVANGLATQSRGPSIQSVAQVAPGVYDVQLTHHMGTDITPASGSTGWGVTDAGAGGAAIAVTAADRQSPSVVRITLASTPVGLITVTYNKGGAVPVGTLVRDNGALTLPLEYTYGVAASTAVSLSVASLTSAPTLGAVALTQTHALSVANLTSAPTLAAVAITQAYQLAVAGLTCTPTLGTVTLPGGSVFNLTVAGLTSAPTLGSVAITQVHNLTVTGLTCAPTLGSVALGAGPSVNLTVANLTSAPTLASLAITQVHQLTVAGLVCAPTLGAVAVGYVPEGGVPIPITATRHVPYAPVRSHVPWRYMAQPGPTP